MHARMRMHAQGHTAVAAQHERRRDFARLCKGGGGDGGGENGDGDGSGGEGGGAVGGGDGSGIGWANRLGGSAGGLAHAAATLMARFLCKAR